MGQFEFFGKFRGIGWKTSLQSKTLLSNIFHTNLLILLKLQTVIKCVPVQVPGGVVGLLDTRAINTARISFFRLFADEMQVGAVCEQALLRYGTKKSV